MAVRYESRLHRIADLAAGLIWTVVRHWHCDRCGRVAQHLNNRQHAEWKRREPVECRRLMVGRRPCRGHLVRAEVSR